MRILWISMVWVAFLGLLNISEAEEVIKPTMVTEEAIFAMGCFWCGEAAFTEHDTHEKLPGIIALRVGYSGGTSTNPTYPSHEGHQEAVKIVYDPQKISYEQLLDIFWHNVDPFDAQGQFCDKGAPYISVIFYKDEKQKKLALASKKALESKFGRSVATQISPASAFYDAEEYHQEYYQQNTVRYKVYRWNCGRDQRLSEIWK